MALMSSKPDSAPARRGFTLVELMVSIAIALLLIIGINQIFAIAQKTVGAGNQLSDTVRTNRSFQARLYQDFRSAVIDDAPFFMMVGQPHPAWRTKADQTGDRDGNVLTINDPFGTGSRPAYSLAAVNDRVHRIDRLMFFARDLFTRQTADTPGIVSPTTSYEAYLWYGHLALPNNNTMFGNPPVWNPTKPDSGNWFNPGEPDRNTTTARNDNNFFASDWILGRQQILLVPTVTPQGPTVNKPETTLVNAQNPLYTPLFVSRPLNGQASTGQHPTILSSRYDMAFTNMDQTRRFINDTSVSGQWTKGTPTVPPIWNGWRYLLYGTGQFNRPGDQGDGRFYGNPFFRRAPQTGSTPVSANVAQNYLSAGAAQGAPILIRGCTQFIVEYAGNFLTQVTDPSSPNFGMITALAPDPTGKIDFIPERVQTTNGLQWTRRTRWYGFPRDIDGDGHIRLANQGLFNTSTARNSPDVLPLRDVMNAVLPTGGQATFERWISFARQQDYGTPNAFGAYNANSTPDPLYVCAWGPGTATLPRPKMLRVTIAVDDPATRLSDPQTYEYVVELP